MPISKAITYLSYSFYASMRSLRIIVLFLCGCFIFSQSYSQSADLIDGCAPLTVNFTPPNGASTFFWDFDDGATSNLSTPSNTFLNAGTYTVEFRNSASGPVVGTITIRVYEKPDPKISVDENKGCAPHTAVFDDETSVSPSVSVTSYSWVFGDGGTASGKNTSHTFFSSGNYFVSLELKTNLPSCDVTKRFDNFIHASNRPNVNYITSPNPPTSCTSPLTVAFTNTSTSTHPLTFEWDFDNGNSSTNRNPGSQAYTDGNFDVELIATDTNNCSNSLIKRVSVGAPTASFEVDDTVCLNSIDTIINTSSAGTYSWTFETGIVRSLSPSIDPIVLYREQGFRTIRLIVTSGSCADTASKVVFIESVDSTFSSIPTYSCSFPDTVAFSASSTGIGNTFFWTFGNDSTSTLKNPSIIYFNEDTTIHSINGRIPFSTTLTVSSPRGCVASSTKEDTVHLPNALLMPDVVDGCVPLEVVFSDSSTFDEDKPNSIIEWDWRFGDGSPAVVNTTDAAVTHTYTQAGEYEAFLIVTTSMGCIDTSYKTTIKVGDQINLNFSVQPTDICLGDTVQFTDLTVGSLKDSIDAWHYYSESDRTFSCSDEANPKWPYESESGLHDVTFIAGFNGCYSEITKTGVVNVKGATAYIDYSYDCAKPLQVAFKDSSLNATSLEWKFGDGGSTTDLDTMHTYANSGDYTVILEASNPGSGCPSDFDTSFISVRDVDVSFTSVSDLCQDIEYTFDASASTDVYIGNEAGSVKSGYTWVFDDPDRRPSTSDKAIRAFSFSIRGENEVTLIGTDINGCKDTAKKTIEVFGIDLDFTIDKDTICAPTIVTFNENNTTADTIIVDWRWNFGDGDTLNTKLSSAPQHLYDQFQDPIDVSLIVFDSLGCSDTLQKRISMYVPTSTVDVLDTTVCVGEEVNFFATDFTAQGSSLNFNWDFGDANSSTLQNPIHTYSAGGIYNIALNFDEKSTGCPSFRGLRVEAREFPKAGFRTSGDTVPTICPNSNILFTDTSSSPYDLSYRWNFGNGETSIFPDAGTFFNANGTYSVRQIVSVNPVNEFGCADTATRELLVRGPRGEFFTDLHGSPICRLDSVLFTLKDTSDLDIYQWDFGDGLSAADTSPVSHQYTFVPPSGQTVAKLILSNADGSCSITRDTLIDLFEVVADFQRNNGIDTAICFDAYPLTNLSTNATNWSWDFGDGSKSTERNPAAHNYPEPETYTILLGIRNNQLGCTDTIVKTVILHPVPDPKALGDTVCQGEIVRTSVINPNSAWSYNWLSFPTTPITNSNSASTLSRPSETSLYTVNVIDTNLCTGEDSLDIVVFNPLNLRDLDTTIIVGDIVTLPVFANPDLYNFQWTPEEGLSCLDCLPPYIRPLDDTLYHIEISDILGCFTQEADFNIKVYPETFISMPDVFSPNGDGINDRVFVEGWGIRDLLEYKIFNRWGELIFETNNIEEGWDGHYNGVLQNNDVYVYKVRVLTWREEEKALEGYINLAR